MLSIVVRHDKNQFGLFRGKHLVVICVGSLGAEKAGAMRRLLRLEIADRHKVDRGEGECRIDVAESVSSRADETGAQFARVFGVVSDVLDTKGMSPEIIG